MSAVRWRHWFVEYRALFLIWAAFMATNAGTGYAAIEHLRPVRQPAVVIDIATARQAALARWHEDTIDIIALRGSVAIAFTALFAVIGLQFRKQKNQRELVRAAERLCAREQQFRDFAEISSDWFWEQDAQCRFRWLSRTALFNRMSDRSYLGATRRELSNQDGSEPHWIEHEAILAARLPFRDFRYQSRSIEGRIRHVSTSGRPIFDDTGTFIGYRGTARDVTGEVEVAEELCRAKEAAEAASRAKSEFLASMSHELRTPLNAIIGFSELMQKQRPATAGGDYAEWASDIMASGRHLLDVINAVLELARIEAGRYVLAQDRVDLAAAVRACLAMVRLQAKAKRIALEYSIGDREVLLRGDSRAVRQILLNLLTNAAKFTPDGGVVRVRSGQLTNGDIVLAVADTGIGIDPAVLASLGQPFTQADPSISRTYGGTGLGPSNSRKFVA